MAAPITISSQRHLDDDLVAAKLAASDFDVAVSPEFDIDGQTYCVVLDGHHSFAAAKLANADVNFIERDASDDDRVALILAGQIDDFLEVSRIDSDYYNIMTGHDL